jgi:hypothetical protein
MSHRGQFALTAPSPARLDGTTASVTWQLHHFTTNVATTAPSTVGLNSNIASMTRHHHCQHDSAVTTHNSLIINVNDM